VYVCSCSFVAVSRRHHRLRRHTERLHAPDYAVYPDAELAAVCDQNVARAEFIRDRFAPNAEVYTDYREMLKQEALDGVTITVPNKLHAETTIAALKAGCHVLCEKPMAASLAEAKDMIRAAEKAGKLLMVNQCQRRSQVHRKAKEVLDSGILGRILTVAGCFGHEGPEVWSPTGKWFFNKDQARFGAMADLGIHKADIIRYLTGKEIIEVAAFTARLEKKRTKVEDNFVSCIKFADGTIGTLSASWTTKGMDADYAIFHCANGSLRVNEIPGRPLVANLVNPECEIDFDLPDPLSDYEDSWGMGVSEGFARAAQGLEEPFCTGVEGARSLAVIIACEKAAETGRTMKVTKI
jgi:UDP-N-acetylglucosamine 3-dehydrogenase